MTDMPRPFFEADGYVTPDHYVGFIGTDTREQAGYRLVRDYWHHVQTFIEGDWHRHETWRETIEYIYPLTLLGNVKTVVDE